MATKSKSLKKAEPKRTEVRGQHEINDVTYGARGRAWEFTHALGKYSYRTPVLHGGLQTAHKLARIIAGACKRGKGEMDGLGRSQMHALFDAARQAHMGASAANNMVTR